MKRIFEIEYPDSFGSMWMNKDNLMICLRTTQFVGKKVKLSVKDVTDEVDKAQIDAWKYKESCK